MNNLRTVLSEAEMAAAWERRDPSYDGVFFLGVQTTGIFCRPSCPSRPRREHLEFFQEFPEAISAGYRPCKRCQPELVNGHPPEWVATLMARVAEVPDEKISGRDLQSIGVSPGRARRWFRKQHGMTFAAWCRGHRLSRALTQMRRGAPMDDVILGHGFESHSGFRAAFARAFGKTPGRIATGDCLRVTVLDTPLGPMLAAADDRGICQLEFSDRGALEKSHQELRRRFGTAVLPGENALLQQLRAELREYFSGRRRDFTVPFLLPGTDFQKRVWRELQRIPFGRTASYDAIAKKIGSPTAVRAVARANSLNRLYLLVPCHRVIARDGTLSGYGGGVWRKRRLLALEQNASCALVKTASQWDEPGRNGQP